MTTKKSLVCSLFLLLAGSLTGSHQLEAEAPATNNHQHCSSDCNCGCKQGGVCTCQHSQTPESTPAEQIAPELVIEDTPNRSFFQRLCECGSGYFKCGVWFPEAPLLFKPFVASPRQICYSAGWRFNDQALVKNVISVSYGDSIPFYRWCDVGPWHGQLQIELQGGLWAVFDPLHESSPLVNADYYIGIPISYAIGPWSFRLRGFHVSSHLGDEFLLNHLRDRNFRRKNPSAEFLDFFVSYYITDEIRLYGGIGAVVHQDKTFRCGRFYAEGGAELHLSRFGFVTADHMRYGRPFYGMNFGYQTKQKHHINQTYVLGYEWGNLYCLERVFRIFMEYHDGFSFEGQFCKFHTNYFSLRVSYGY